MRKNPNQRIEEALYEEQKGLCFYCEKHMDNNHANDSANGYTIDHFFPRSINGKKGRSRTNRWLNSVLCHYDCNQKKGSKLPTEIELEKFLTLWINIDSSLKPTRRCTKKLLPVWKQISQKLKENENGKTEGNN